jgi:D-alanine-D-alanine ligase
MTRAKAQNREVAPLKPELRTNNFMPTKHTTDGMVRMQDRRTKDPLPRHVAVLYSVVESWDRGVDYEHIADEETAEIAQAVYDALAPQIHTVTLHAIRTLEDVNHSVSSLESTDAVVFNLVEALGPTSGPEAAVPRLLGQRGFAYVGNTGECLDLCLDKGRTKEILVSRNIPTAPYQVFEAAAGPCHVTFPAIVKALSEDCSLGLTTDSVVFDQASLLVQVQRMLDLYKQPALVEQFLSGHEYYASLWDAPEPQLLAIAQADYSKASRQDLAFDHFQAKWDNDFPSICPAPIDDATWKRIEVIARAAYLATGCRDYARVDLREHEGKLFVLEVNPNPCLAPSAGFAKAARTAGYPFDQMALQLVRLAWSRA